MLSPFSWLPNHERLRALRNNSKLKLVTKRMLKFQQRYLWRILHGDSWANKLRPQPGGPKACSPRKFWIMRRNFRGGYIHVLGPQAKLKLCVVRPLLCDVHNALSRVATTYRNAWGTALSLETWCGGWSCAPQIPLKIASGGGRPCGVEKYIVVCVIHKVQWMLTISIKVLLWSFCFLWLEKPIKSAFLVGFGVSTHST